VAEPHIPTSSHPFTAALREPSTVATQEDRGHPSQLVATLQAQLLEAERRQEALEQEVDAMLQKMRRGDIRLGLRLIKAALGRQFRNTTIGGLLSRMRGGGRGKTSDTDCRALADSIRRHSGKLIVVFPIIPWEFRWQRPQHIVSRLRDHGYSCWYLDMELVPCRRNLNAAGESVTLRRLSTDVTEVGLRPKGAVNLYMDRLEGDDLSNVAAQLASLIAATEPTSVHYLVQFPGWWPLVETLKRSFGGTLIFDCMDDHGGFSTKTYHALSAERTLIRRADLVVASSAVLEERCLALNPRTIRVRNGTEFDHFHNAQRNGSLDDYAVKPIVGYYGAIAEWFDAELLAYCAGKRPDWNFVLIGSTVGANIKPLQGLSNVLLLGEKPYANLPGYFAYFDVCVIPFKIIPLTLATNPVKFYEYVSAGKPVVSVRLPELEPYEQDCYLASGADEFLARLDKAMAERHDTRLIARRIELARENSWDARVEALLKTTAFEGLPSASLGSPNEAGM